ncbi:MAG: 50S ribosomal protein L28 [Candidatus Bipolaricaulota bacterium]
MSKVCEICGKHPTTGNTISHSHRHTHKMRLPNIKRVHAYINGKKAWIKVCTRCIKSGRVKRIS